MDDPLVVEHVDVWAATIEDRPGGLANVLAELREVGADLQFIIARRAELSGIPGFSFSFQFGRTSTRLPPHLPHFTLD